MKKVRALSLILILGLLSCVSLQLFSELHSFKAIQTENTQLSDSQSNSNSLLFDDDDKKHSLKNVLNDVFHIYLQLVPVLFFPSNLADCSSSKILHTDLLPVE